MVRRMQPHLCPILFFLLGVLTCQPPAAHTHSGGVFEEQQQRQPSRDQGTGGEVGATAASAAATIWWLPHKIGWPALRGTTYGMC